MTDTAKRLIDELERELEKLPEEEQERRVRRSWRIFAGERRQRRRNKRIPILR